MRNLVENFSVKTLKRINLVCNINIFVFGIMTAISFILVYGLVGTNDYYTIELKQAVPQLPTIITIQPVVFIIVSIILIVSLNLREVVRDEYRERRSYYRSARRYGRIDRRNES